MVDLRDAAPQQILPHRGARLRVNGQHPPRHQSKEPIRQAQNARNRPWRHSLDGSRANARCPEHSECLIDLGGEQEPPAPIGKLLREWNTRESVESIVEVEDQLTPQESPDVAMLFKWGTRDPEEVAQAGHARANQHLATAGTMKVGRLSLAAHLHHIEGNHTSNDRARSP